MVAVSLGEPGTSTRWLECAGDCDAFDRSVSVLTFRELERIEISGVSIRLDIRLLSKLLII